MNFLKWSYSAHEGRNIRQNIPYIDNVGMIDEIRTKSMFHVAKLVADSYPHASWMTIGDGRFGCEAYFLQKLGVKNVLATDIVVTHLEQAAQKKYIKEFAKVNAENIEFGDCSYDFVLCKESFHHFPRPYAALYEMLRVCKLGTVLHEPSDSRGRILDAFKESIKRVLRRKPTSKYEPSGNYIYTVSLEELEKLMCGIDYPYIIYKYSNDFCLKQINTKPNKGWASFLYKLGVGVQDILCKLKLLSYGKISLILFKEEISDGVKAVFEGAGIYSKNVA